MPKYLIERDLPGAGKLSPQELQVVSQKSCGVLSKLGPAIQWVESYVTDDKVPSTSLLTRNSSKSTPGRGVCPPTGFPRSSP